MYKKYLPADQERDFNVLKRQILKDKGFDCNQYRDNYIKRRLAIRLRANNVHSCKDYAILLKREPTEYDKLIEAFTITVSGFFRDTSVFAYFRKAVIPALIQDKRRKNQKIIRLWSAGCASGEETYSIAILMSDFLGANLGNFLISVRGTDIDDESLEKAKRGEYTFEEVKSVGKGFLSRYFIFDRGKYCVRDKIKGMVNFEKHDLVSDKPLAHFDVIFCRNVSIYFSMDMHEKLYLDFYNALNNDGFFVMGKTEMLCGSARKLFIPVNAREGIYQKKVMTEDRGHPTPTLPHPG
ncbi:protein-glutamate O-methyltransferase CheR [Methanophagales archaeon]|nr:MAG: protein-glutamate O-methyltransferase CheR [Methanophagales archaeon]